MLTRIVCYYVLSESSVIFQGSNIVCKQLIFLNSFIDRFIVNKNNKCIHNPAMGFDSKIKVLKTAFSYNYLSENYG